MAPSSSSLPPPSPHDNLRSHAKRMVYGTDPTPFLSTISNLSSADDSLRSEAKKICDLLENEFPNALCSRLSEFLVKSPRSSATRSHCSAILLGLCRGGVWPRLLTMSQNRIKETLLESLRNETDEKVSKNLSATVSAVAAEILPQEEWPELNLFIFECLRGNGLEFLVALISELLGISQSQKGKRMLKEGEEDVQLFPARLHIQIFCCRSDPRTIYCTNPCTVLLIKDPEANFIQELNPHCGIVSRITMEWLAGMRLRGYTIGGWLLFSRGRQLRYYNVLTFHQIHLPNCPWDLVEDHSAVFSDYPDQPHSITLLVRVRVNTVEILRFSHDDSNWQRFVVRCGYQLRLCSMVIYRDYLLWLDEEANLHAHYLDGLEAEVYWFATFPGHVDLTSSSFVRSGEDYYFVSLGNGVSWLRLNEQAEQPVDFLVEDDGPGDKCTYAVNKSYGYSQHAIYDWERACIFMAGRARGEGNEECICVKTNLVPPNYNMIKRCSRLICECDFAFIHKC